MPTYKRLVAVLVVLLSLYVSSLAHADCKVNIEAGVGHPTICHCYDDGDGFGVERKHMVNAIDAGCKSMAHIVFGPDGSGNYQHALNTWHYPTTANYHGEKEEGLIAVQFWWNDGAGGGAPNCLGSVIIPYDVCMIGMHMLIDGCATETASHKWGGKGNDTCIEWTVDSNPIYHDPDWDLTSRRVRWDGISFPL
ncbi:hypothetical protein B0A48_00788 [Cryoendolithus antarcticus]|uniref:Uncharacterized protein n=1 Tax=Cryoendolithus antarcticus TaxID=1507870 RepID=A0A1V8TR98_9PEZI|nr:hypothetical protein B0A48_00788 [Cryoendolithus antarcticus]